MKISHLIFSWLAGILYNTEKVQDVILQKDFSKPKTVEMHFHLPVLGKATRSSHCIVKIANYEYKSYSKKHIKSGCCQKTVLQLFQNQNLITSKLIAYCNGKSLTCNQLHLFFQGMLPVLLRSTL